MLESRLKSSRECIMEHSEAHHTIPKNSNKIETMIIIIIILYSNGRMQYTDN